MEGPNAPALDSSCNLYLENSVTQALVLPPFRVRPTAFYVLGSSNSHYMGESHNALS